MSKMIYPPCANGHRATYNVWKKLPKDDTPDRWMDFLTFLGDVGDRPSKKSRLRKRDAKLPWGPGNATWIHTYRKPWTEAERTILKSLWKEGDRYALMRALPGRALLSIYEQARWLGLPPPSRRAGKIEEKILKVLEDGERPTAEICELIGLSPQAVRRALKRLETTEKVEATLTRTGGSKAVLRAIWRVRGCPTDTHLPSARTLSTLRANMGNPWATLL